MTLKSRKAVALDDEASQKAVRHLLQSIQEDKHWYTSLLESIGMWAVSEEEHQGRHYQYLVGGEAFDWLLLAERLASETNGLIPQEAKEALLFRYTAPIPMEEEEFKGAIGSAKYTAVLNYWYGVVVEEALLAAVEEELGKSRVSRGFSKRADLSQEAFEVVYWGSQAKLLALFRQERGYPQRRSMSQAERKEFTYWLFKYRVRNSEPARVASDTRKGLEYLRRWGRDGPIP